MLAVMPNRQGEVIKEHQAILEALTAGDTKAAVKSMQAHFESGQRGFKKQYASS
jgi:DNA-binding GntR family transcriptional regulator